jgi:hypothetical protein
MAKKRDGSSKPKSNQLERNEEIAPHTAEVVCPCYAGWEAFEKMSALYYANSKLALVVSALMLSTFFTTR